MVRLYLIVYLFIPLMCNSDISLRVEGLDSELEYNVRKRLSDINTNVNYVDSGLKKKIDTAIRSGLRPLGYYAPTLFFFSFQSLNTADPDLLVIKVEPGMPVIVTEVNVILSGDGIKDVDYQKIVKDSRSFIGKKLNHNDYEQFKNKLYNLALFKGYFDAKFQNSQLVVIPSRHQSIWNIDFFSGQRYVFERIKFHGSHIKENYLKNISNIHPGEYYSAESVMALNRRLSSTNWFESVSISSDYVHCHQKKN